MRRCTRSEHTKKRRGTGTHLAVSSTVHALDDVERRNYLLAARHAVRGVAQCGKGGIAQVGDEFLGARDVAAHRGERLGVGSHEDVHVRRRDACVVAHALAVWADGADAVRLVHIQVRLVPLLQLYDLLQREDLTLHGVDALHHDENLGPRPMRPRLPFCDRLAQHALQV